jgi:hypothetical protein
VVVLLMGDQARAFTKAMVSKKFAKWKVLVMAVLGTFALEGPARVAHQALGGIGGGMAWRRGRRDQSLGCSWEGVVMRRLLQSGPGRHARQPLQAGGWE